MGNRRAGMTRHALSLLIAAGSLVVGTASLGAHKAVTSKYTYTEDVFPILRDKCGRCHAEGGAAPMSLLTYKDDSGGAVAWAESMREMLVSLAMPPWYADPAGPAVKNNHSLTPRELDVLVTWAAGGTPLGDPNKTLSAPAVRRDWLLGKPDLEIRMDREHALGPGVMEDTAEFSLPTNLAGPKWIKAADLLPGSALVRRAEIAVEGGPVLAIWEPGDDPVTTPPGMAFELANGARLHLRMSYKKPWQDEQNVRTDQSSVGLYFANAAGAVKMISTIQINGSPGDAGGEKPGTFGGALSQSGRVVAIRPSLDQPYASVDVEAVLPSHQRIALLKLRGARPEWPRRYWLTTPAELPPGATLEVRTQPGDPDSGPLGRPTTAPLFVALDIVSP
jgi:hypothetical protein